MFDKTLAVIYNLAPDTKIKYKDEVWWWAILPENRRQSTTTLGKTIYFPSRSQEGWIILAHEGVHEVNFIRSPFQFFCDYLFPQWLAIIPLALSIATFLCGLWPVGIALIIVATIILAPHRSRRRLDLEKQAFLMTLAIEYWLAGRISEETIDKISKSLCGATYYYMVDSLEEAKDETERMAELVWRYKGLVWEIPYEPFSNHKSKIYKDMYELVTGAE